VSIDFSVERLVSLQEALQLLPSRPVRPRGSPRRGKRRASSPAEPRLAKPNLATIYRWAQIGIKGIRLETVQVGGCKFTSREALARFFAALSARTAGTQPQAPDATTARKRAVRRAEALLDAHGV